MEIKTELFKEQEAVELSKMIYEIVDEMEKSNPDLDYKLVREEDAPNELIKASKEGKMWVAKIDNKIVGTISLTSNRLRRFFVHPDYQQKGIGKKLIEQVKDYMKNNDIGEVWVGAVISAIPIYKKLGFIEGDTFLNPEINQKEMKMKLIL